MFLLPYFASSQIWLNCLNDHGNQCIITKLEKEHWFGPLNMSHSLHNPSFPTYGCGWGKTQYVGCEKHLQRPK